MLNVLKQWVCRQPAEVNLKLSGSRGEIRFDPERKIGVIKGIQDSVPVLNDIYRHSLRLWPSCQPH